MMKTYLRVQQSINQILKNISVQDLGGQPISESEIYGLTPDEWLMVLHYFRDRPEEFEVLAFTFQEGYREDTLPEWQTLANLTIKFKEGEFKDVGL